MMRGLMRGLILLAPLELLALCGLLLSRFYQRQAAKSRHERRLQGCLRALGKCGWEQRLAPLAQHMAEQRLVCGRGYAGAPLRHLDLEVLRKALSNLLRDPEEWDDALLIMELAVEGAQPAQVEELRDAVEALAVEYEDVAYAGVRVGVPATCVPLTRVGGMNALPTVQVAPPELCFLTRVGGM